jgi:hypothetical protein
VNDSIRFDTVAVAFPSEAPVITVWMGKEIERWIRMNYQQETTVEITFKTLAKDDGKDPILEINRDTTSVVVQGGGESVV